MWWAIKNTLNLLVESILADNLYISLVRDTEILFHDSWYINLSDARLGKNLNLNNMSWRKHRTTHYRKKKKKISPCIGLGIEPVTFYITCRCPSHKDTNHIPGISQCVYIILLMEKLISNSAEVFNLIIFVLFFFLNFPHFHDYHWALLRVTSGKIIPVTYFLPNVWWTVKNFDFAEVY